MERPVVCVSGASVWAGISTECVYETTEASDGHSEAHRTHQGPNFCGQSVRVQQGQVSASAGQGHGSVFFPDLRICDKLAEIAFGTDKDLGIFGADHRFRGNATVAPDKESARNQGALQPT